MELNSLNVRTPFTASNATFALNSSVCCFRFATTITPPLLDNTTPSQSQLNYLSKKRGELQTSFLESHRTCAGRELPEAGYIHEDIRFKAWGNPGYRKSI
jgi:hypothetical protein